MKKIYLIDCPGKCSGSTNWWRPGMQSSC
jgi:hypothetical protein